MRCGICGGILALLGTLGRLTWLRCVNCGMDQSTDAPLEPDSDTDD